MKREDNIYYAKLSEQAERYQDMVRYLKDIANGEGELTNEERNLLSVAYKNYIGAKRTAWRAITAIEQKEEGKGSKYYDLTKKYKDKVEKEVDKICTEVFDLLDKLLIPKATTPESKVFYYKMKGDYSRYLAECLSGDKNKEASEKANEAYRQATEISESNLAPTNPIRLGLALNYSVFFYEIMNQPEQACKLAKAAFDGAISDLEQLEDEVYKDSATIMQLLRDNLTLWTSDIQDEGQNDKEKEA